jgi:hypothetical protein
MRISTFFYFVLLLLFFVPVIASAQSLEIIGDDDIKITISDSVHMKALYKNNMGDVIYVPITWTVMPDSLGNFNAMDYFIAEKKGKGYIYAAYQDLIDSVAVKVVMDDDADDDEKEYPCIKIMPDELIQLAPGDSIQLMVYYKTGHGEKVDTTATWSVVPDSLGYFNPMAYFVAEKYGTGWIYAQLDTLKDSVMVMVTDDYDDDEDKGYLTITPEDTIVNVGQSVQFKVWYVDTSGAYYDTTADWKINGNPVGSLTGDGLFTAILPGMSVIKAKLGDMSAGTSVTVIDTTSDTTGVNMIHISRVLPTGKVLPPHEVHEGGAYKIGGIPTPYNIINGGILYFPMGSLKEDITIHIKLPGFMTDIDDSTMNRHKIVSGIQFDVLVNDTLVEPYYFEIPLHVSIPFKKGILKKYDLTAEQLSMYFATQDITFDSIGISNVYVDSIANRIFGMIEHFSTIVVKEKDNLTSSSSINKSNQLPRDFELMQNYPNPFNPVTTIEFMLTEASFAEVKIYSVTGEEVATVVSGKLEAGTHRFTWDARDMASGVYFYKMRAQGMSQVKKMVLLR